MTRQLFRFGLVGLLNTLVGFSAIAFLNLVVGVNAVASNIAGFAIGAVCSYALNKTYTFESRSPHARAMPTFFLLIALCLGVNLAVLWFALESLRLHPIAAQACAVLVYNVCFFLGSKFLVFRE